MGLALFLASWPSSSPDEGIDRYSWDPGRIGCPARVSVHHLRDFRLPDPVAAVPGKEDIHELGGRFEGTHLFSLKGKFASFAVFMLITLVVINSFTLG